MRKSCFIFIVLLFGAMPCVLALDEVIPQVEITNAQVGVLGQEYLIDVSIAGAYVENSVLEIDFERTPGWGDLEQSYFEFIVFRHDIEQLQPDESIKLTFILNISEDAAEKNYTIPILFYGKIGECEDGCVPFRYSYSASLAVLDPSRAQEKESLGDSSFAEENYSIAKMYYDQAKALYESLGNDTKAAEMGTNAAMSQTGVEAVQLFDGGMSKFNAGNKDGALSDFLSAKEKFLNIGNTEKVAELDALIALCANENGGNGDPDDGNGGGNNMLLIGGAIIALIVVAAMIIKYK